MSKPFTTQQEVEDYEQTQQVRKLAELRGFKRAERKSTTKEALLVVFLLFIVMIVVPTIEGLIIGK
jgi:pyruvate-formate lyase